MCGIFGLVAPAGIGSTRVAAALDSLAHRGPDQEGSWANERVYVGHRRLSILDLSERARQPFVSEDGKVVVAVNGEVYNFRSLRADLEAWSRFRTTSDSEVVLHGYRAWGIDGLLKRMEGMYAFSIFDVDKGRVYLARDRVGIKPLYFSTVAHVVAWASELKALEALFDSRDLDFDASALYDFLTYLYVPTPKTLYRNVFKLEPGHYVEVDIATGAIKKYRYWQLRVVQESRSLEEAAEQLRSVIHEAVKEQLCSDVPIGFFLSGGMDSSVVVAEAATLEDRLHTYSIGFSDPAHDETSFAQQVASRYGTEHRVRILEFEAVKDMFPNLRTWFDEPFADTSALPTYLVSAFAKETCKVVLTGDGGDEVFGGYGWYKQTAQRAPGRSRMPRKVLPILSGIRRRFRESLVGKVANRMELGMLGELELHARLLGGLLKENKQAYAREFGIGVDYDDYWYFRQFYRPELPTVTRLQYLDFHTYLPDDILTKVDRVSMAVALEARVPLLATAVVEYAFSLPESIRLHGGEGKGILRYAYADRLPRDILHRGKRGFSIPARSYVAKLVQPGQSKQEAVLRELYGRALQAA